MVACFGLGTFIESYRSKTTFINVPLFTEVYRKPKRTDFLYLYERELNQQYKRWIGRFSPHLAK